MALFFGSNTPSAYYLGSGSVNSIYFGDTKVWPFGLEVFYMDMANTASYIWPTGSNNQQYVGNISANKLNNVVTGALSMVASMSSEALRYSPSSSVIVVSDPSGSGRIMRFGNFYTFGGGQNNYLTYETSNNNYAMLYGNSGYSFEMWVRPYRKTTPNFSPLYSSLQNFSLNVSTPGTNDGALFVRNKFFSAQTNAQSQSLWTPSGSVTFNQWNHIVLTAAHSGVPNAVNKYLTSSLSLYVNGVQKSAQSSSRHIGIALLSNGNVQPPMIGRDRLIEGGDVYANMDLSQMKIYYNKTLEPTEVLELYDNTKERYGYIPYNSSSIVIDPATYDNGGLVYNTGLATTPVTGTLNGFVQYTSSIAGGVFNFTRPNINTPNTNYIEFNSYNFGNEATFMAWIYPKGQLAGGSIQTFLANTTNWSESNGFKLSWDPLFATANSMGFENGNGFSGTGNASSTSSIVDNQWQHMTWTYNKNTSVINMYRNGILQPSSSNYTVNAFNTNAPFLIGSMYERNPPFGANYEFQMNAMLGVVKITDSVLPTATILSDYQATKARYGV